MTRDLELVLVLKEQALRSKERYLEALNQCESVTVPLKERVQSSPKPGQDEDKRLRYIELKEKSEKITRNYLDYRNKMLMKIEPLSDELFIIAYKKYFVGETWRQIAEDLEVSYTTIMKRKKELCTLIQ